MKNICVSNEKKESFFFDVKCGGWWVEKHKLIWLHLKLNSNATLRLWGVKDVRWKAKNWIEQKTERANALANEREQKRYEIFLLHGDTFGWSFQAHFMCLCVCVCVRMRVCAYMFMYIEMFAFILWMNFTSGCFM